MHFTRSFSVKSKISVTIACVWLVCGLPANASDIKTCVAVQSQASATLTEVAPLPQREGPRIQTSGRVPHVQVGLTPNDAVNRQVYEFAFSLPGVEERPTIVSLPGATGMWLADALPVLHPKAIVAGREFSHMHPDGSFHAPLPFERALEVTEKGWGERHPWAARQDGWEGFVMIYSARSIAEMKTVLQLVAESYNHITGENIQVNC